MYKGHIIFLMVTIFSFDTVVASDDGKRDILEKVVIGAQVAALSLVKPGTMKTIAVLAPKVLIVAGVVVVVGYGSYTVWNWYKEWKLNRDRTQAVQRSQDIGQRINTITRSSNEERESSNSMTESTTQSVDDIVSFKKETEISQHDVKIIKENFNNLKSSNQLLDIKRHLVEGQKKFNEEFLEQNEEQENNSSSDSDSQGTFVMSFVTPTQSNDDQVGLQVQKIEENKTNNWKEKFDLFDV